MFESRGLNEAIKLAHLIEDQLAIGKGNKLNGFGNLPLGNVGCFSKEG